MNALIKKEIRLLWPIWLAVLLLETVQTWLWKEPDRGIMFGCYIFFFGIIILAVNSFGREFSLGTFQSLISQPKERRQIWRVKITVLSLAALLVYAAYFASGELRLYQMLSDIHSVWHFNSTIIGNDFRNAMTASFAVLLVALTGGLWTTLLLRQITAAFWITCLTPAAIFTLIALVMSKLFNSASDVVVYSVLYGAAGLYVTSAFWFARWLFLRAQDLQWSGGTIVMPEMRGLARFKMFSGARRSWRPAAALWRKEFLLHQSQFVMAFVLLLLHLGVMATRHFGDFKNSRDLQYVLEIFWGLWLVLPMLVGCAAVAEERKFGTLEGQLCLPVKRRTQFAIKFSVVIILSVLLGAVMPLLVEGTRILPDYTSLFHGAWRFWPALFFAGIAILAGGISFYVSSLARNTLQSLAPAVLGILLAFFSLMAMSQMQNFAPIFLWRGPLGYFVFVPVMLFALWWLAFRNFQEVRPSSRLWRKNLFTLALALVFALAATSGIYHRAWEKLTLEPAHGAARLSLANPARLSVSEQWLDLNVRLPDGKVWLTHYIVSPQARNPLAMLLGDLTFAIAEGRFINGSNWLAVNRCAFDLVGLKDNGSLWVSENPWLRQTQKKASLDKIPSLVPFGMETNWSSFVPVESSVLLVKTDGTLWFWGTTNFNFRHEQWPGLRTFDPYQVGSESNWAEISTYRYELFLRKRDGQIWTTSERWNTNGETFLPLEPGLTLQSIKNFSREKFRSVAQIWHGSQFNLGVRADGTLRIWAEQRVVTKNNRGDYIWFPTDLPIGGQTNWIAVAGVGQQIVTLKNDGSLWLWNFRLNASWDNAHDTKLFVSEIQGTRPTRLGNHSDWIAICGGYNTVTALAADGSLWCWPLGNIDDYYGYRNGEEPIHPLRDISHKPQLLGNVFEAVE